MAVKSRGDFPSENSGIVARRDSSALAVSHDEEGDNNAIDRTIPAGPQLPVPPSDDRLRPMTSVGVVDDDSNKSVISEITTTPPFWDIKGPIYPPTNQLMEEDDSSKPPALAPTVNDKRKREDPVAAAAAAAHQMEEGGGGKKDSEIEPREEEVNDPTNATLRSSVVARMRLLQNMSVLMEEEEEEEHQGNLDYKPVVPAPLPSSNDNDTNTATATTPSSTTSQPGAYLGAPGEALRPTSTFTKSSIRAASSHNRATTANNCPSPLPSGASSSSSLSATPSPPVNRVNNNAITTNAPSSSSHSSSVEEQQQQPTEYGGGEEKLVQATQLSSSHFLEPEQKAIEVDPLDDYNNYTKRKREGKKWWLVYAVMGGLVIAIIIIAMVFGLNHQEETSRTATTVESSAAGNLTSATTTTLGDVDTSKAPPPPLLLIEDLPNYTLVSLEDPYSVQSEAYRWLQQSYPNNMNNTNLPQWRRRQLLALATFYFALDGPNWMKFNGQTWLDNTKHECNWYSTTFGTIEVETNTFVYLGDGKDVCNDKGEYIELAISTAADLGIILPNVTFPPELSLLTSLTKFSFRRNGVTNTLKTAPILPPQFFQLSNLQSLKLSRNSWNAPIPTQVGLLTKLELLNLNEGNVVGSLPTELGLATSLKFLMLQQNSLTGGSIPSQIGRLTNLVELKLTSAGNLGGGAPLPTELGLMMSLEELALSGCSLGSTIPTELTQLPALRRLRLHNNNFVGSVPPHLPSSLKLVTIQNISLLSGTVPEHLCYLATDSTCSFVTRNGKDNPCSLEFDCTDLLCGCDCDCSSNSGGGTNFTE